MIEQNCSMPQSDVKCEGSQDTTFVGYLHCGLTANVVRQKLVIIDDIAIKKTQIITTNKSY